MKESPSNGSLRKSSSIITLTPILVTILVSFAVYSNALLGDFVFDDKEQILDNPWIKNVRNVPAIFSESVWSFKAEMSISNYYRPLMHVVYMLNYYIFGLKPWGYHLVNVLFHCGVAVFVFLVIRRFLVNYAGPPSPIYLSPPFIAAMLFASHPIHTEAVTWIAGLPDVAFTFFYLLSFYLYILSRDGVRGVYLLSILSFGVATLFKEPALTLPLMLTVYDYVFQRQDRTIISGIKKYLPYLVVAGVYLVMRYHALGTFVPIEAYPGLSTYQFIINVVPLFKEYLTSVLWPFDLNLWHTFRPINSLAEAEASTSVVVTVIFFIVAVVAYKKNKLFLFGLLLFVIPLAPVFYIKGIGGKPFAERYLYLPSVGFVLLLAIFISWAKEKVPRTVTSITIVSMIIVGIYCIGTVRRNTVWKDNFSLWSDTVKKSPDSGAAHLNLGIAYAAKGLLDMAITEYQTALRLKPYYMEAHNNLGNAYADKGLLELAVAEYQTALYLNPNSAETHNNLGTGYMSKGLLDMAISEFQAALRLNPNFAEAHYNLGVAYASRGLLDMAITEYEAALRLNPNFAEAYYNLESAYSSKRQFETASKEMK